MFNKEKIIELITQDGLFIDNFILEAFIKNWKIDPIYEDENGVEYFDEMTVEKIKEGISRKNEPKCEIHVMDKDEVKPVEMAVEVPLEPIHVETPQTEPEQEPEPEIQEAVFEQTPTQEEEPRQTEEFSPAQPENVHEAEEITAVPMDLPAEITKKVEAGLQNITVDISNQTLAVLAQSIARKITSDVSEFLKRADFIESAVKYGEIKQDNKLLLEKMDELLADNRLLVKKLEELERENSSFVKLFGNIYVKS